MTDAKIPPEILEVPGGQLEPWGPSSTLTTVGKPAPRRNARDKVTGRARYASDVQLPGMLHAVILRSTIPRGKVTAFDVEKANALPGVRAILTADDYAKLPERPKTADHPFFPERDVLAHDVRFVGEEIAAVAADTPEIAAAAARLIKVTYQELPAVLSMEKAFDAGAAQLAPKGNLAGGEPEVELRGDLEKGEKEATKTLERTYSTDVQFHHCLESHGCVAVWDRERLTLYDSNQGVHFVQDGLAGAFGLPMSKIQVLTEFTGGGFGSKNGLKPHHVIASLLARQTGRPVRLFMDRRQEFVASNHRARSSQDYRAGVDREGRLVFMDHTTRGQAGPDEKLVRFVARSDCTEHLYACPNLRISLHKVLTNHQSVIPCRGPTTAENLFALEQFMDELAHELSMDPLEFRKVNHAVLDPKEGKPYSSKGLLECYAEGAKRFGWKWKPPTREQPGGKRRGIGMSSMIFHGTPGEPSQAIVMLRDDGTVEVLAGITDFGAGASTILAQVAAEEIGAKLDEVSVSWGDSRHHPYTINSSYGSRTTSLAGPSVRSAAHAVRRQVLEKAARMLEHPAEGLEIRDGIVRADPAGGKEVSLREIAAGNKRERIIGIGNRHPAVESLEIQIFGAHFAEVEVDTGTGQVKVLRAVCAYDAGRWLNPLLCESQIQGGFIQGMGMALSEEWIADPRNGMQLNDSQLQYMIPTIVDAPDEIVCLQVETLDLGNSLNAKGIAEPPLVATGAAIANAIHNAIGVRIRDYPITPRRVLAALKA